MPETSEELYARIHDAPRKQFAGNFAAVRDDVLPIVPDDVRRGNLELVARGLRR